MYPLVAGIDGALAGTDEYGIEEVVERTFCCCLSVSKPMLPVPIEFGNNWAAWEVDWLEDHGLVNCGEGV